MTIDRASPTLLGEHPSTRAVRPIGVDVRFIGGLVGWGELGAPLESAQRRWIMPGA